jgi:hypothetical protein
MTYLSFAKKHTVSSTFSEGNIKNKILKWLGERRVY